ncbi:methyltransferase domain-containing protein [Candidatus Woesearchaeota archaeon]|nr:methyltransferase domain-containing protein [Candidatus Woesearchaeota archaeon]
MDPPNEIKKEFGKNSALYDEARPTYPSSVVDDVIEISGVPDNGDVLDIGCGPGRATILFGERGYQVIGVDFSEELIDIAREKSSTLPNVSYVVGEFETVDLSKESFDLIISGQALHWIIPEVGYKKISDLLKDSGTLAAFWNFEDYDKRGLVAQVRDLYLKHCPIFPPDCGSPKRYIDKLDTSGLFEPTEVNTHYWNLELTKDKYVKLIRTWGWVSSLPDEESKKFLDDLSELLKDEPDNLSLPYKTILLTTKKSQSPE